VGTCKCIGSFLIAPGCAVRCTLELWYDSWISLGWQMSTYYNLTPSPCLIYL